MKERFLIGRNRTKRAHFRGSSLFQATYNIKTETQTIDSTYPVPVGRQNTQKVTKNVFLKSDNTMRCTHFGGNLFFKQTKQRNKQTNKYYSYNDNVENKKVQKTKTKPN